MSRSGSFLVSGDAAADDNRLATHPLRNGWKMGWWWLSLSLYRTSSLPTPPQPSLRLAKPHLAHPKSGGSPSGQHAEPGCRHRLCRLRPPNTPRSCRLAAGDNGESCRPCCRVATLGGSPAVGHSGRKVACQAAGKDLAETRLTACNSYESPEQPMLTGTLALRQS